MADSGIVNVEPIGLLRSSALRLLDDGVTIELALVCTRPELAEELYDAIAAGLVEGRLRIGDYRLGRPASIEGRA